MKKTFTLIILTFIITASNQLSAQKNDTEILITKSDRYSIKQNSSITILEGNVAITFGKLDVSNADKITIDKAANKGIVVGVKEFAFKGKLIVDATAKSNYTTIEYTIGNDVAHIK